MYKNILIPTDGSKGTDKAIDHALDLAEKYDAKLHTLYIVNTSAYSSLPADSNWESIIAALEEEGEQATTDIEEIASEKGVEVVRKVDQGVPHRDILEYSRDNDIDLIVMGTHGKTGINRLLLGSTTEKVVRTSDIPILTVRMNEDD